MPLINDRYTDKLTMLSLSMDELKRNTIKKCKCGWKGNLSKLKICFKKMKKSSNISIGYMGCPECDRKL